MTIQPGNVLCPDFIGFGAQGDCQLRCPVNAGRGVDEQDIKGVFNKIRAMRPHVIRTFFAYQWWEPEEGRQTRNSAYMRDYVEYLKFLKSIGCKVNLTPWGDWFSYSRWMKPDPDSRMPSGNKRRAMIRSLVDLVDYLWRDKGLTNVSQLTLMNEPDNSKRAPNPEDFVELNKMLEEELKARGLRDQIFMVGVDGSGWSEAKPGDWFYDVLAVGGADYFDGAAAHTYGQNFDCATLIPWVETRTQALGRYGYPAKPFMITEFGSFGSTRGGIFTMSDNDKYEYGLFLARFALIALRHKTANVLMWCLFDTYYDTMNKQECGLLRWKDEGWMPRPGYYSWSLLTRYTRPGSRVVNVDYADSADETSIPSVALLSPRNELTFLAVNSHTKPVVIHLKAGVGDVALDYFEYSNKMAPTEDHEMIRASATIQFKANEPAAVTLPAQSFIVLTNVEQNVRQWAREILALEKMKLPFYTPDRALVIAPDADTAWQLREMIKKGKPEFRVITFASAAADYDNPVPLPDNWTMKHMIGAVTNAYVIEPGKGYPADVLRDFDLVKKGSIYLVRPSNRDREPY
ncbi:MAG: hypothetical protein WCK47_09185 [bacterium]|nr:hypothetical protein [Candidatus Sumerlaeota bacterium]